MTHPINYYMHFKRNKSILKLLTAFSGQNNQLAICVLNQIISYLYNTESTKH